MRFARRVRALRPLPPQLRELASGQRGYLSRAQLNAGGITPGVIQRRVVSGAWSRPRHGVVDTIPFTRSIGSIRDRHLDALELTLVAAGPGAVAIGLGSLLLSGNTGLPRSFTPQVVQATRAYGGRRSAGHIGQHSGFEITTSNGRSRATTEWAVIQAAPHLDRLHLLAVLDSALHQGELADTDRLLGLARGRRGAGLLSECSERADGRSESILETWARLLCTDAGIAPDALQLPITRDGVVVARSDLAWRLPHGRWLLVEIDGREVHSTPEAVFADRRRANLLTASGRFVILRFTARDLAREGYVVAEIKRALAQLSRVA